MKSMKSSVLKVERSAALLKVDSKQTASRAGNVSVHGSNTFFMKGENQPREGSIKIAFYPSCTLSIK